MELLRVGHEPWDGRHRQQFGTRPPCRISPRSSGVQQRLARLRPVQHRDGPVVRRSAVAGGPILQWIPVVVIVSVILAVFASGFALALSTLSVYFRDMTYLWTIFVQVWFFLTPVVYGPELLKARAPEWADKVLQLNPMRAFVSSYRDLLYDARCPSLSRFVLMAVSAMISLTVGWWIFHRMGRRLPEEV
ncbi:MAG: hypothetical protein EB147_10685 [Acidimicrobiia bacterium]|nr:hypothetical protein [Acidimicrobiia bacterium]